MGIQKFSEKPVPSTQYLVLSTSFFRRPWLLSLSILALTTPFIHAAETPAASAPSFSLVRALFAEKCLACHGSDPKELKGDYDLRTREAAIKGGESGEAAIVPGDPSKSPLYRAVSWEDDNLQMPPKANDRLSKEQVALLRAWIAGGAKWEETAARSQEPGGRGREVRSSGQDGIRIATSSGRSPDWDNRAYDPADVWAYQPITHPQIPSVGNALRGVPPAASGALRGVPPASAVKNPIDAFLLQALRTKGIESYAPPADPTTLLRRLTFGLTGLPPVQADHSPLTTHQSSAYANVVKALLSSPHYGEQQARHWLDVVRYADTAGFSNDFERPNSWRYRDYVVRSFNADKPFDRFVTEQLAGDELDANDPELLIAVGYLRMGPWEHTGMTVAAVTRQQYLDDVTNHIGVSLLGQGLRCAGCHDHKFDPVPTRDYYRIQAVFSPVQFVERPVPFLKSENISNFDSAKGLVEERLAHVKQAQAALTAKNRESLAAFLKEHGVKAISELPAEIRQRQDLRAGTFGLSKTELSLRKMYAKTQAYLERELKRFEPFALSLYSGPPSDYTSIKPNYAVPSDRSGTIPVVHILPGGSIASPADEVTPGVLSAMFGANDRLAPSDWNRVPNETDGRRLALARWIASPENTLTARVIVNRIWQQHFGKGLVATPNNFGKMGARPTHAELLDWLATWFMDNGWSLKKLHELIVTSQAYQQSSERPDIEKLQQIDSKNELLAYFPPRRLAAEEIRDALLAASGELNREMGGPGVYPELNWEVALQPRQIMGAMAPAYIPSRTRAERSRRTIYSFRIRNLADPMLEVLNRPGSETSCERRDETTVTPQVFALFNSEFAANRALALASRLTEETPSERAPATLTRSVSEGRAARIAAAFQSIYGRPPNESESQKCLAHLAKMTDYQKAHPPKPTELPTSVRRSMVEEMTGDTESWDEDLSILKNYERDLMPWQVEPEVRALADVCLVLMNSNEFLYVR